MPSDSETTPPDNLRPEGRRPPRDGRIPSGRRVAEFGRPAQRPTPPPSRSLPPLGETYDQPFLRNPYVLAGLAVAGAIVLAVIVVLLFGGSGSGSSGLDDVGIIIDPLTPGPGRGIASRSVATATVREGPGLDYLAIGELSRNQDVEVVGRNDEGTWYNVYFPPGSSLRGWVPASALRLPNNTAAIPVVSITPIPRPTVIQPTPPPEPTGTITATPTATGTGTPTGGSDLEARIVPGTCAVGSQLIISVQNKGPAALTSRAIQILVQSTGGATLATAAQLATIPVGGQVDIATNYVVQERVVATVDPLQTIGDPNIGNNRVDCVVSGVPGAPTATRTSTSAVPPPIATATRTPAP